LPFRTGSAARGSRGVLTLRRRRREDDRWEWDLDLGVRVRATVLRPLLVELAIAAGLAATPIIAASSDASLSGNARVAITAAAVISGLVAGMAASFGLPRSL